MKLVIGKQIGNIVSAYAPQVGLSAEEKDDFWDSFINVISGILKQESIFIGRDLNGHAGRDANKYGCVHRGMGFGTRNAGGKKILEFGDAVGMAMCNTFIKKEDVMIPEFYFIQESSSEKSFETQLVFCILYLCSVIIIIYFQLYFI